MMGGTRAAAVPRTYPALAGSAGEALLDRRTLFAWLNLAPTDSWLAWRAKRVVDVVLAATLLVVTAPLLLGAMVLIRLSTRGPATFTQVRVGYRGRPFRMYKLRTMVEGAAALENELAARRQTVFLKLHDDPRVTPVGRFLRRTSIDELPQLVNVLRGDMSLVGPRPLLSTDVQNFPASPDRLRFAMLPGITGLWQVSGRSSRSDEDRLRLDTEYVERWSMGLDLKILLSTIPAVLIGRGAV